MADRTVALRDGRKLGIQGRGDPLAARIVVFCHPAPGACTFDPVPLVTSSAGVHLLAFDRPGYGASTPLEADVRPSVADRADDIAEYLTAMRAEISSSGDAATVPSVGVVGWSAGGRVALALAARYPGLVDRVAVVATPAPDSSVSWIPPQYAESLSRLAELPTEQAKAQLGEMLQAQRPAGEPDPALVGVGEADAETLDSPGTRDRIERMLEQAYVQGVEGVVADLLSYATDDWGFDFGAVTAKTLLVYGGADAVAGSAHGRWYRHRIPHAKLTVVPRRGHLVIVDAWQRILDHMALPD
jgi:pimeloyl-ACP methyl ester carboxylesterase